MCFWRANHPAAAMEIKDWRAILFGEKMQTCQSGTGLGSTSTSPAHQSTTGAQLFVVAAHLVRVISCPVDGRQLLMQRQVWPRAPCGPEPRSQIAPLSRPEERRRHIEKLNDD